jgi:hypothetical protein
MRVHRATIMLVILGIIGVAGAYVITKSHQFVLFWGNGSPDFQRVYTRAEHPQFFMLSTICSLVVGLALLAVAAYVHFGLRLRTAPRSGPLGRSWFGLIMFGIGAGGALVMYISSSFSRPLDLTNR